MLEAKCKPAVRQTLRPGCRAQGPGVQSDPKLYNLSKTAGCPESVEQAGRGLRSALRDEGRLGGARGGGGSLRRRESWRNPPVSWEGPGAVPQSLLSSGALTASTLRGPPSHLLSEAHPFRVKSFSPAQLQGGQSLLSLVSQPCVRLSLPLAAGNPRSFLLN